MRKRAAIAVPLVLVIASSVLATSPAPVYRVPPEYFRPVLPADLPSVTRRPETPPPPVSVDPRAVSAVPTPSRGPAKAPEPKPQVVEKTPKPKPAQKISGGNGVVGLATWYCKAGRSVCHHSYPDRSGLDFYAAAGSEIRRGDWRGRRVGVCRTDGRKCIVVRLVDWCACKGNRIIDLYWDAFDALNVRGETGGIRVRVTWQ